MRITVRVIPNARVTKVGGRYGDGHPPVLAVRVTAPAVDGKANAAAVEALAGAFGLPVKSVQLVSGERSRIKVIEVETSDPGVVAALLQR